MKTFDDYLSEFPPPGQGHNSNKYLMATAGSGVRENYSDKEIFDAIRDSIPEGSKEIADKAIWRAIHRARSNDPAKGNSSAGKGSSEGVSDYKPQLRLNGKIALRSIIEQGMGASENDFHKQSPVMPDTSPENHAEHRESGSALAFDICFSLLVA